jgi:MFS family permease
VGVRSTQHPVPLIEPVILRTRSIALANLGGVLFFMAFAALLLGAVLFQTSVWHASVLRAGLQFAPGPLMAAVVAVPGGLLGARVGQRYVGAAGALLFALGGLWFRAHMAVHPHYATALLPTQLVGGAGVGLVLPALSAAATGPLPPSRFATGTGVLGMARQLGSALGVALFVAILGQPTAATAVHDFRNVWTFLVLAALGAGVALISMGRVRVSEAAAFSPGTTLAEASDVGGSRIRPARDASPPRITPEERAHAPVASPGGPR